MKVRPTTVRMRLTALYGGLFVATTIALLVTVNLLVQSMITAKAELLTSAVDQPVSGGPGQERRYGVSVNPVRDLGASVLDYQWNITWIAAAVLAVVGVVAGWLLAGRLLAPVHRITATAQRLSLSTLHERIALTGPRDELRELADTFDAMLDRLERAADSQRRFAANTSHELRTPLAIQRAAIEIGLHDPSPDQLARMRKELLEANRRTERLIDGLLALAQGERGPERWEPVDLADVVHEVTGQHRHLATENGIDIDLDTRDRITVIGDPVLLAQLVANLLHNAIRHNHTGGHVHVHTSAATGLTVSNSGPQVPTDRLPELFEPFRRLHPPRTGPSEGAGLGLSIVAAIADAHHAQVDARPNPDGGLTITVALPTSCDHHVHRPTR